ncbi:MULTISPECIES: alpha/beta fold hydrolase [unclassified Mycobacterium]|uniref:alpha/beta fold hydrolase n=1 Tax=unclassified Mycobacterium TaxID=2642494 RepID=UPI0029C844E7|nr:MULTISPECIES: alpha/beta fold hydrolase [unclassified Mycobacterium]
MPTDRTFTAADGTELIVRTSGRGRPIVFLHGSNGGLDSWAEIAEGFPDYSVWLIARRGYRPSGVPLSRNSFEVEADDVLLVARAAAEETRQRGHLVGGSYGASLALHAAKIATAHLASLALFEPPLLLSGAHLTPVLAEYRKHYAAGEYAEALGVFIRDVARIPAEVLAAAPNDPIAPDEALRAATGDLGDLEAMSADTTDLSRWTMIDVPILLMQGGDTWAPLSTGMDELAAVLPAARRVVWEGESHFATSTVPGLVGAALRSFFGEVEGS